MPQHRCPICDQPIQPCPNPVGAHLLCPPTAECRHELCQLLAGDLDDAWPFAVLDPVDSQAGQSVATKESR